MAAGRDFGELINERRLALGYSLGQLANRVRSTASEVRAWERGQRAPSDEVVSRLATELDLDPDDLVVAAHRLDDDHSQDQEKAQQDADATAEATAAVMGPVFSDAADTAIDAGPDEEDQPGVPDPEPAFDGDPDESDGEESTPDSEEPAAAPVAAGADAESPAASPSGGDEPPAGGGDVTTDEDTKLADLPTEAVPIVAAPVAIEGAAVAVDEVVAVQAPSRPIPEQPAPATKPGPLDPITSFLRVLFDPDRRYLFWARTVLMLVVFIIFFRVLAWAVPAFFDTLGEILDTIESTTTDTTLPGG